MPLYTYIVTFNGGSYVAQGRHSNFKGFVSSWADIPTNALPGFTSNLLKELGQKAHNGSFDEVPNRKHVWSKTLEIGGGKFMVYAVQTEP